MSCSAAGSSESAGSGGGNGSGGKPESAAAAAASLMADGFVSEEGMKDLARFIDEINFAALDCIGAERRAKEAAEAKAFEAHCRKRSKEQQEETRDKKRRLAESCATKIDNSSEVITADEWDAYFTR